jgi:hypothetical protein
MNLKKYTKMGTLSLKENNQQTLVQTNVTLICWQVLVPLVFEGPNSHFFNMDASHFKWTFELRTHILPNLEQNPCAVLFFPCVQISLLGTQNPS